MPLNQSPTFLSFALNACNDASPSGVADAVTGQPIYIGDLDLGVYFDLTEAEANSLSYTTNGTLHSGRYRRILVDSGATAANVKTGTIGLLASAAKGVNVITSYDQGTAGLRPVVFLNVITPGNYGFIQELGDATVLGKTSGVTNASPAIGDIINSIATGVAEDLATPGSIIATTIGMALTAPNHTSTTSFRVLLENVPVVQG